MASARIIVRTIAVASIAAALCLAAAQVGIASTARYEVTERSTEEERDPGFDFFLNTLASVDRQSGCNQDPVPLNTSPWAALSGIMLGSSVSA